MLTGSLPRFYASYRYRLPFHEGGYRALTVDRQTRRVVHVCKHKHRNWMTAQNCAEKMTRKFAKERGAS